jgi:hypothetical protein
MNAIVTTTNQAPTAALEKFSRIPGWKLYVVGDRNTPSGYEAMPNIEYLSPSWQERAFPALSQAIGWNCIQRRNIGFVHAFREGAGVIATVDDDNIPYEHWGRDLLVGQTLEVDCYENAGGVFDVLSVTNANHLWHRGYPVELLSTRRENRFLGKVKTKVLVQADLWDGDPDVDAMCRLIHRPIVKLEGPFPCTAMGHVIFNSQNTFLDRSVLPHYAVLAHADRMDDIWGGLLMQNRVPERPCIVFQRSSVYQQRNYHHPVRDLEREIPGYYKTMEVLKDSRLEEATARFFEEYTRAFE